MTITAGVPATFDSIFGNAIPVIIGKAIVLGRAMWSSTIVPTATTSASSTVSNSTSSTASSSSTTSPPARAELGVGSAYQPVFQGSKSGALSGTDTSASTTPDATVTDAIVNFAVAFGKPDATAVRTYISRIWCNGTLIMDASGKTPITLPGYSITTYNGAEDQLPDPTMAAIIGDYCPAFRGLIYCVFENYDLLNQQNGDLPTIIAEVTQTDDEKLSVFTLPSGPGAPYLANIIDSDKDTMTMVGVEGIDVYSFDTSSLMYSLPSHDVSGSFYSGRPINNDCVLKPSIDGKSYYYAAVERNLTLASLTTNAILAQVIQYDDTYLPNQFEIIPGFAPFSEYVMWAPLVDTHVKMYGRRGDDLSDLGAIAPPFAGRVTCFTLADIPAYAGHLESYLYLGRSAPVQYKYASAFIPGTGPVDVYKLAPPDFTLISDDSRTFNTSTTKLIPTFGGTATNYNTLPDPTQWFDPIDTSRFQIVYFVVGANQIWRAIIANGSNVPIAQIPSQSTFSPYFINVTAPPSQFEPTGIYSGIAGPALNEVVQAPGGQEGAGTITDPENEQNGPINPALLIYNEPQIQWTASGITVQHVASVDNSPGSTLEGFAIAKLITGPANNAFVSVILTNDDTMQSFLRTYDTFWSRKMAANRNDKGYDANYYIYEEVDTTSTFYNPRMKDSTFNFFQPYADKEIPYVILHTGQNFYNIKDGAQVSSNKGIYSYGDVGNTVRGIGKLVVLNAYTGAYTTPGSTLGYRDAISGDTIGSPVDVYSTLDVATSMVYTTESPTHYFINGGAPLGQRSLAKVLTALCVASGYTADQVRTVGLDAIFVDGAVINQSIGFTQLLDQLAQTFVFDYFDTNGKINFVKQPRGADFAYDLTYNESDLAPANSSADDGTRIKYDRAYAEDLPKLLTLEYIDKDNSCVVGTQTAKRAVFPIRTASSDQTIDLQVPIVMSAAQAIYFANAALFDIWASATKSTILMSQAGLALEPGDFYGLTLETGEIEPLKITGTTLNGDLSVSLTASSIAQYSEFDVPADQKAFLSPAALKKAVPPNCFVFDNVLLYPGDDLGTKDTVYRFTADQASSLYLYNGTGYDKAASIQYPSKVGIILSQPAKVTTGGTNPIGETDRTTQIKVRLNDPAASINGVTNAAFLVGASFCLVGSQGRWEVIFFRDVIQNADKTFSIGWLQRGRRGTEVNCNLLTIGDTIVFPTLPLGTFKAAADVFAANLPLKIIAGAAQTNASTLQVTGVGAPLRPWAPCNLKMTSVASTTQSGWRDLSFFWNRRTRYDDALHDGDSVVTNEFGSEAYTLTLFNATTIAPFAGFTASSPSALITAEMLQAAGLTSMPTKIGFGVSQVSPIAGAGPAASNIFPI